MKVKTRDLIGPALDWAVAKCEGFEWKTEISSWYGDKPYLEKHDDLGITRLKLSDLNYHQLWGKGGPIIDDKEITIDYRDNETQARRWKPGEGDFVESRAGKKQGLLAAMRCYVASELGEEVEVPNELIKES